MVNKILLTSQANNAVEGATDIKKLASDADSQGVLAILENEAIYIANDYIDRQKIVDELKKINENLKVLVAS